MGRICGSSTRNYLLEKIRVVNPAKGERNFHIFYQLIKAADAGLKKKLCLEADASTYKCGRPFAPTFSLFTDFPLVCTLLY
jgi:myosin-1